MLRDINLIFLGFRVLSFLFYLLLVIDKPSLQKAVVVVPSVVYLLLGMYVYLYPGRFRLFKNYGDLFFLSLLTYLSGQKEALFTLLPPIALYASRKIFYGLMFFWAGTAFGFYYYGYKGFILIPLFLSLLVASIHPDLVEAIAKERRYVRKLRRAYREQSRGISGLERELSLKDKDSRLLEVLLNSPGVEEYLKNLKEAFSLKAIHLVPYKFSSTDSFTDSKNSSLYVPVKLEKGHVYVVFQFNSPLELRDEELIRTLEKAGKLINIYVEGFEEKAYNKVNKVMAV